VSCTYIKQLASGAIVFGLLLGAAPAPAEIDLFQFAGGRFALAGRLQEREEVWNWFNPGNRTGQDDNRYNFLGGWLRVGLGYERPGVQFYGELMSPSLLHLPDDALAPAPQGALGFGANYFQSNRERYGASLFLKQGFFKLNDIFFKGSTFQGGRFEFFDGAELMPDEPELKWLVTNRIQQRVIGNFGFTDVLRSFDGLVAGYAHDGWTGTLMYGKPTKGVFDLSGMDEVKDIDLLYAALDAGPDALRSNGLARLFYILYSDRRGLIPADNESPSRAAENRSALLIHTAGGDLAQIFAAGPGSADLMLWGAYQFGSWGARTQRAWAADAEGGYRFTAAPATPWLRAGYTITSGDSNPNDSTHGTFFSILPTPRLYALFPCYNLMNLTDAFGELVLFPTGATELRTTLHGLWLTSARDLWYSGGGAFQNHSFGFAGRPSFGRGYLATVLDEGLSIIFNRHFALSFYYGHAFGGDVVSAIYPGGKEADFGFIQTTLTL
jgi:hypothetical protein